MAKNQKPKTEDKEEKKPFHVVVAENLIKQLEAGTAPWQRPWELGHTGGLPMNPTTGKRYRGINSLQLMMQGHQDSRWLTYKQAEAIGAQVRRGERGTMVQYWKFDEERNKTDELGKPVKGADGEPETVRVRLERPKVFHAVVFNAEQIDGLPPAVKQPLRWDAVDRAEAILQASGARIEHASGDRAFYRPSTDGITMPYREQFRTADDYYATALHELGHWTGHESRLARDLSNPFGSEAYAKEELRAEIASMLMGDELGIGHDPGQHVAYVKSWVKVLKDDPMEILRAAADAEKIHGYVMAFEQKQVQEQDQTQQQQAEHPPANALAVPIAMVLDDTDRDFSHFHANQASPTGLADALRDAGLTTVQHVTGDDPERFMEVALARLSPVFNMKPEDTEPMNAYLERKGLAQAFAAQAELLVIAPKPEQQEATRPTVEQKQGQEQTRQQQPQHPPAFIDSIGFLRDWNSADMLAADWQGIAKTSSDGFLLFGQADGNRTVTVLKAKTYSEAQKEAEIANELAKPVSYVLEHKELNFSGYHTYAKVFWEASPAALAAAVRDADLTTVLDVTGHDPERFMDVALARLSPVFKMKPEDTERTPAYYERKGMAEAFVRSAQMMVFRLSRAQEQEQQQEQQEAIMTATPEAQNNAILAALESKGWVRSDGTAIAAKTFDTVNGENTALVYLSTGDGYNRTLQFNFTSEGRDVTAADGVLIPFGASEDQAFQLATAAAIRAEESIQESYGVRIEAMRSDQAMLAKEERKAREFEDMREDRQQRAAEWTTDQAAAQAEADAKQYQEQTSGVERDFQRDDMALNAAANADYRAALFKLVPEVLEPQKIDQAQPLVQEQRQYIDVPFKEKNQAKSLGAKWDRAEQSWYIPPGVNSEPFDRWAGKGSEMGAEAPTAAERPQSNTNAANTGRVYLAVPYTERFEAKTAGAAWDKAAKSWYAGPNADMATLERWKPENVKAQQDPAMTPREEFAEALRSMQCVVDGEHPIMDGQRHRIKVVGDAGKEKAGFYVGHLDGHPAGYITNNRSGEEMRWKSAGYSMSDEDKAKMRAEAAEKLAERAAEHERVQGATADRLAQQLASLVPADQPTAYMLAKGITSHAGAFTDAEGQKTYLPATDVDGKVWTMQYIQDDGTKRFAKDSRKEGCFHAVGGLDGLASAPAIVIAEGYATAATLAESLGHATVAAFDSGNLQAVALALHAKYPDKPVIVAGDDDRHLPMMLGNNPGREKAIEAAAAVGGQAIFPVFAPGEASWPADVPAITPNTFKKHQAAVTALEAGDQTAEQEKVLKADLLSQAQLDALANLKRHTDFNDLATRSTLGREGATRQAGAAVSLAYERKAEQAEQQQQIGRDEIGKRQQVAAHRPNKAASIR